MISNRKKTIRVVGAAIMHSGKLLVAQRPYSIKPYKSLKWEFPGGKIEAGETVHAAIMREINEELNCVIDIDRSLPEIEYEYPDFIIKMTICICYLGGGSYPKCLEHNAISWIDPIEGQILDWAAADALGYSLFFEALNHQ